MYFGKKAVEEIPESDTQVWSCTSEGCNGWMRDNFAFAHEPVCAHCHAPMVSSVRSLPQVHNDHFIKMPREGTLI